MDLPELLARAGIQPNSVADLMTWARARTSTLLANLDASSPLGQSLAPGLAQLVMRRPDAAPGEVPPAPPVQVSVADDDDATQLMTRADAPQDDDEALSDEIPVVRGPAPSRGSPRAVARVITKPYLGAAVEAALQAGESSGSSLPDESLAPPPPPAPNDDDEAAIGGFTRLAFSVRRPNAASERPSETRAPLAHGFALHAEKAAAEASQYTGVPAPPSFQPAEGSARLRAFGITGDSERSTSLVVGIPDDDSSDVPIPRQRSRSAGLEATASGSLRAAAPISEPAAVAAAPNPSEMSIELNLAIEDPELSSALFRMVPEGSETSSTLTRAIPQPAALVGEATDPLPRPLVANSEMSLQIPITIEEPSADTPAPLADAAELEPAEPSPTRPRKTPPPPPPRRTSAVAQPDPEPAAQPAKRARGKKKVVELGAPVARPITRPVAPVSASSRPSREVAKPEPSQAAVPNYLVDDDE